MVVDLGVLEATVTHFFLVSVEGTVLRVEGSGGSVGRVVFLNVLPLAHYLFVDPILIESGLDRVNDEFKGRL